MGSGFKDWAAGDVLTAADVDGYLMRQTVMTFADSSARDTALSGVLDEGMVAYLEDTDVFSVYDGSSWFQYGPGKILQVVSTTKTDTFSASVTAGNTSAITGLSASITPTSADSDVLIIVNINGSRSDSGNGLPQIGFQISRGATSIGAGTTAGNRVGIVSAVDINQTGNASYANVAGQFLDSPATTSATTYSVDVYARATDTYYINRTPANVDSATHPRTQSTITVMEVSA